MKYKNNFLLNFVWLSESQWSIIQIEAYRCRWQCTVYFREFLSKRRQRVVIDGATSEWIPIVFGVPQGCGLGRVLFCSSFIPVKCLSWWRTDYMPMLTTLHYWQLFASQQTDLLLLPPLAGTWLGFRSGAITGA